MEEIIVEPHIRIGQLKLGMTSDELENALLQMKKQRSNSSDEAMQMERCAETDDPNLITGRYMDNDSFFLVQYRNGKAAEIGIYIAHRRCKQGFQRGAAPLAHDFGTKSSVLHLSRDVHVPEMQKAPYPTP